MSHRNLIEVPGEGWGLPELLLQNVWCGHMVNSMLDSPYFCSSISQVGRTLSEGGGGGAEKLGHVSPMKRKISQNFTES